MKIAMIYHNNPPFTMTTHETAGLGGSENGFINTVKALASRGHVIFVFNRCGHPPMTVAPKIVWADYSYYNASEQFDVACSFRHKEPFADGSGAKLKVIVLADTESGGLGQMVMDRKIDLVIAVSHWQKEKIAKEESIADEHWLISSNGVDGPFVEPFRLNKDRYRCIYIGTPERGLSTLLTCWEEVVKEVPQATLELFSSFQGWGVTKAENAEMLKAEYAIAATTKGVANNVHGNANDIRTAFRRASFYLYPTDFYETCCMSVLEAMYCGVIPVGTARAALIEKITPVTGYPIPAIGASSQRYRELFVSATVNALKSSDYVRNQKSQACAEYARPFHYDNIIPVWEAEWMRRLK